MVDLDRLRYLWEETETTAAQIGEALGLSRSAVIGHAYRRGWVKYAKDRELRSGLDDRLDGLHAVMDRVLEETAPVIEAAKRSMRTSEHAVRAG